MQGLSFIQIVYTIEEVLQSHKHSIKSNTNEIQNMLTELNNVLSTLILRNIDDDSFVNKSSHEINQIIRILYRLKYDFSKYTKLQADLKIPNDQLQIIYETIYNEKTQLLICCGIEMKLHGSANSVKYRDNHSKFICSKCLEVKVNNNSHRRDIEKPQTTDNTYVALKHFEEHFNNMFSDTIPAPMDAVDEMRRMMARDGKKHATINDVRSYLQQINKTKYNDYASKIMIELNGYDPIVFSKKEFKIIEDFYLGVTNAYFIQNQKRCNLPNCPYIIKLIIKNLYDGIDDTKKQNAMRAIYNEKQKTVQSINNIWDNLYDYTDMEKIIDNYRDMLREALSENVDTDCDLSRTTDNIE